MAVRNAEAVWTGSLKDGRGDMRFGAFEGRYTFASRFEEGDGTNPEELIGAAHAGCFSMALSGDLGRGGFNPEEITTTAEVHLGKVDGKSRITKIHLSTVARVPDISEERFMEIAEGAKEGCPISNALGGVPEITLDAKLVQD